MARRRRIACLALTALLTACRPQLASSEARYLAEGYTKLSDWAYVRERPDGHGFSFVFEGELGEAVLLTHLQDEADRVRGRLRALQAEGTNTEELRRLRGRVEGLEQVRRSLIAAGRP